MSTVYRSPWGGRILVFGGLMGILTSWNAFFIGASRLMFAMSRGGMLPAVFSRLHPKYESPVAVIALLTGITTLAPLFGRPALVWLVDAGALAAVVGYFLVALAFGRIRSRHPDLPRPYRTPAGGFVGGMAILTTVFFLVLYLPGSPSALVWPQEWGIVLGWIVLGALFGLARRRGTQRMSRTRQEDLILGDYAPMIRGPEGSKEKPQGRG
jgi:amino acid transporter